MTPTFPASYSTLAANPLGVLISTKYAWRNVQCRPLLRGVSDTYSLTSSAGNFVLRVYRNGHRTLSQINAEVEFLLALKNSGVSVSYPLPDRDGHHVFSRDAPEGTRHGVVFTHAPGTVCSAPNDRQLKSLGREMAKLHSVSTSLAGNGKMATNICLPGEHSSVDIDHCGAWYHFHRRGDDQLSMYKSRVGESGRKFEE